MTAHMSERTNDRTIWAYVSALRPSKMIIIITRWHQSHEKHCVIFARLEYTVRVCVWVCVATMGVRPEVGRANLKSVWCEHSARNTFLLCICDCDCFEVVSHTNEHTLPIQVYLFANVHVNARTQKERERARAREIVFEKYGTRSRRIMFMCRRRHHHRARSRNRNFIYCMLRRKVLRIQFIRMLMFPGELWTDGRRG